MDIVSMPLYTDFWAQTTNCEKFTSIFSLKRFQKLRCYLHFANNENASNSEDKLYKIRSVLDAVFKNCKAQKQELQCSIDEMMVPYKGTRAGNLRQHIQNKLINGVLKFLFEQVYQELFMISFLTMRREC
jgi:hypothetical protein